MESRKPAQLTSIAAVSSWIHLATLASTQSSIGPDPFDSISWPARESKNQRTRAGLLSPFPA